MLIAAIALTLGTFAFIILFWFGLEGLRRTISGVITTAVVLLAVATDILLLDFFNSSHDGCMGCIIVPYLALFINIAALVRIYSSLRQRSEAAQEQ